MRVPAHMKESGIFLMVFRGKRRFHVARLSLVFSSKRILGGEMYNCEDVEREEEVHK